MTSPDLNAVLCVEELLTTRNDVTMCAIVEKYLAAEREACAQLVEDLAFADPKLIADRIRARSKDEANP